MPEISVLIPCLNEAKNLPQLADRLESMCIASDLDIETLILDDASDDGTIEVAKQLQTRHPLLNVRVIRRFEPRRGYGAIIRYGMAYASGRYCLLVTADGAHPTHMLPQYLAKARQGAQLVQCSRYERPEDHQNIPPRFKAYQALYRNFVHLLLGWDVRDPTCSFKLVDRVYLQAIGIRSNGMALIPEIVLKIRLAGGKIEFVPGSQTFVPRGISHFHFFREVTGYGYVLLRAALHRVGISWF